MPLEKREGLSKQLQAFLNEKRVKWGKGSEVTPDFPTLSFSQQRLIIILEQIAYRDQIQKEKEGKGTPSYNRRTLARDALKFDVSTVQHWLTGQVSHPSQIDREKLAVIAEKRGIHLWVLIGILLGEDPWSHPFIKEQIEQAIASLESSTSTSNSSLPVSPPNDTLLSFGAVKDYLASASSQELFEITQLSIETLKANVKAEGVPSIKQETKEEEPTPHPGNELIREKMLKRQEELGMDVNSFRQFCAIFLLDEESYGEVMQSPSSPDSISDDLVTGPLSKILGESPDTLLKLLHAMPDTQEDDPPVEETTPLAVPSTPRRKSSYAQGKGRAKAKAK